MILTYIFGLREEEQNTCPFIPKTVAIMPYLFVSLRLFATDANREHYLEDEDYSELIVTMIEIIVTTATEKQYKDTLNDVMRSSIIDICLNLMVITREEAETIREDAEEYINLTLDCCDKQSSMNVKS